MRIVKILIRLADLNLAGSTRVKVRFLALLLVSNPNQQTTNERYCVTCFSQNIRLVATWLLGTI